MGQDLSVILKRVRGVLPHSLLLGLPRRLRRRPREAVQPRGWEKLYREAVRALGGRGGGRDLRRQERLHQRLENGEKATPVTYTAAAGVWRGVAAARAWRGAEKSDAGYIQLDRRHR